MKPKLMVKISIDFIMMISLLALMAYEMIGAATHEVIGTFMLALVIAHNVLNLKWWKNIAKGKYAPIRIIQTIINLLIFTGLIVQAISGIMLSKHVFTFLPISGGASIARTLHLIGAYWSFTLMSIHLGVHGSMLMGVAKKVARIKEPSRIRAIALRIVALFVSAYGVYAFIQRELGSYMLLQNQFVFFNFDEPLILFFIDYIAISGLFVCVGHYFMRGIKWFSEKRVSIDSDTP